jgi:TonB family protein
MPYSLISLCAVVVFIGFALGVDAEQRRPRVFTSEELFMSIPDRLASAELRRHDLSARLKLVINPDGRVRSATVIRSSGDKTLDAIATKNFSTWNFAGRGCDIVFVPLTITTEDRRPLTIDEANQRKRRHAAGGPTSK